MEGYQNQILQENSQQEKISASGYLCRQSSTRWTPTTEQIKVLKDLYYINGVRSPTADQIQAICSRLRRYGKIEGKNVFYWFQNHKARERQKKRLIPNTNTTTNSSLHFQNTHNNNIITENNGNINYWKQDENIKYPCINSNFNNTGISCSSSSVGVASGGAQFMGSFGYGAVNMENKLRDCSISGVFNGSGNVNSTSQWTSRGGYATYSNFHDKVQTFDAQDHDQDPYVGMPEKETLPLFPMHDKDAYNNNNDHFNREHHFPSTGFYTGGYHWSNGGGANGAASLELSLNSCGYGGYSHNY